MTPLYQTATHCCYCALLSGMKVHVTPDTRRVAAVEDNTWFPVNREQMCVKGQTSAEHGSTAFSAHVVRRLHS